MGPSTSPTAIHSPARRDEGHSRLQRGPRVHHACAECCRRGRSATQNGRSWNMCRTKPFCLKHLRGSLRSPARRLTDERRESDLPRRNAFAGVPDRAALDRRRSSSKASATQSPGRWNKDHPSPPCVPPEVSRQPTMGPTIKSPAGRSENLPSPGLHRGHPRGPLKGRWRPHPAQGMIWVRTS